MTEYVTRKGILSGANSFMAISAAALVMVFLAFTIFNLELADKAYVGLQQLVSKKLAGYFVWVVTVVAGFSLILAISPFGAIKLGGDDEQPAFGHFSWFAMLFSVGVGTGILFWSVAEPMIHHQGNPFIELAGIEPNTAAAAIVAQRITLFHWGIHGWAIYSVIGLCLAYFSYRNGLPLSVRSAMYPLLGDTRPPRNFRIFWGMAVGLVSGALLLAGGLQTLQAASTTIAVPFSVAILLMMVGLSKLLWQTETRRYN